jgi:hypothetical protein
MSQDDLSDVIPIGVTITITDGVQEMKFGKRICEIQGYGENGWTNEMMLDYFTDLCRVYDAWAESKSPWVLPEAYEDLVMPEGIMNSGWDTSFQLRDFVAKCYEKYAPRKLSEILGHLGVSVMDWYQSVCNGRTPTAVLDVRLLNEIEVFYTAITPPYPQSELMAATKLTRNPLEAIGRLFRGRRIAIHGENALKVDRAPRMLRYLIEQGEYQNHECLRRVYEATGVKFSKSYASKIKQEIHKEKSLSH